jgi:hypothetical protein
MIETEVFQNINKDTGNYCRTKSKALPIKTIG